MSSANFDALRLARVQRAARDVATILANACPDPDSAVVGLTELLLNAVEHGNLGITYERAFDTHGRGIAMARRLSFSSLDYRGAGNEVVATVRAAT
jgi:hypothetical protein